jgi:hypothetical protein
VNRLIPRSFLPGGDIEHVPADGRVARGVARPGGGAPGGGGRPHLERDPRVAVGSMAAHLRDDVVFLNPDFGHLRCDTPSPRPSSRRRPTTTTMLGEPCRLHALTWHPPRSQPPRRAGEPSARPFPACLVAWQSTFVQRSLIDTIEIAIGTRVLFPFRSGILTVVETVKENTKIFINDNVQHMYLVTVGTNNILKNMFTKSKCLKIIWNNFYCE